nr:GntR family transcriptional regulator [uncultured Microbacterium sp.]
MSGSLPPRGARRATDEVHRILHSRIVSGELAPGTRIDIEALADEFDVSRTPVREAVLLLASAGMLERQPYRGTVVTGVDITRLEEVTALRITLEGLATELGVLRLSDADVDRMESIEAELERVGDEPDFSLGLFNDLNRDFHAVLFHAADAPVLHRLIEELGGEADRIRLHFPLTASLAHRYHRAIIEACRRRDVGAAREATERHLLEAYFGMRGHRRIEAGPLSTVLAAHDLTSGETS